MNENLKKLIIKYLDRYYYTKEGLIFRKDDEYHEWGAYLASWISNIFSTDYNKASSLVMSWAESKPDVMKSGITELWQARQLIFKWPKKMALDLERLGIGDVNGQIINFIIDNLSKEINVDELNKLKSEIKTVDDLLSVIRCIGYDTRVEMNTGNLEEKYYFIRIKYHDMIYERQSNHIWQNHFRPTRVDEQTQVTS